MTISSLIGSRLLTGLGALAIAGSVAGGTAAAANSTPKEDNPVRELRHELRDQTKAEREEIKDLRKQLASEYAKDSPDVRKMNALHEQIEARRAQLEGQRFQAFIDMHDELDAAQRERVAERMAGKGKGKHGKDKAKGKGNKAERKASKGKHGKDKAKGKGKGKGNKAERKASKGKGKDRRPT